MDTILMVVHQETSNPGLVGEKLRSQGYTLDIRCPALGDSLPPVLTPYRAVVVFRGTHERQRWRHPTLYSDRTGVD
jgi:hypothetical protein